MCYNNLSGAVPKFTPTVKFIATVNLFLGQDVDGEDEKDKKAVVSGSVPLRNQKGVQHEDLATSTTKASKESSPLAGVTATVLIAVLVFLFFC